MTKKLSAAGIPGFADLTPREQAFVQHPEVYSNPRKAALECGYSSSTIEKRAHSMRQRLMRFIQPGHETRLAALGVDRRRVEEELAIIGFLDITEYQERIDIEMPDGGFQSVIVWKDPASLPPHMRRAIKSVSWGYHTNAEGHDIQSDRPSHVTLYSKEKALHELVGLFSDVVPTNPADEQQKLFDNLDPAEKETMIRLHMKAARRAAANSIIEGEHANREETVRRLEGPSDQSDGGARITDDGGAVPEAVRPDPVKPADRRRVAAPRPKRRNDRPAIARNRDQRLDAPKATGQRAAREDDDGPGYRELPD